MNENELVSNLRKGSEEAFEFVFKKYFSGLCLFAEHYVKDKQIAEEIVEDFFCYLWEKCNYIAIESSLKGYLYTSIHNRCLKYLRHQKVQNNYIESLQYLFTDKEILEPVSDSYPEDNLISKELEEKILHEIDALPDQCKKIFSMNRFENLTYIEISEKLGLSVNTVKTQMARALEKLRNGLKEYLNC